MFDRPGSPSQSEFSASGCALRGCDKTLINDERIHDELNNNSLSLLPGQENKIKHFLCTFMHRTKLFSPHDL